MVYAAVVPSSKVSGEARCPPGKKERCRKGKVERERGGRERERERARNCLPHLLHHRHPEIEEDHPVPGGSDSEFRTGERPTVSERMRCREMYRTTPPRQKKKKKKRVKKGDGRGVLTGSERPEGPVTDDCGKVTWHLGSLRFRHGCKALG